MAVASGAEPQDTCRRPGSLPLAAWPAADRDAWDAACSSRPRRFARGGAASHLAAVTRQDLAARYGYFLDYLDRHACLDRAAGSGDQVREAAMAGFVAELRIRVSSITLAMTVYKVRRLVQFIAPRRDLGWLIELERDLAFVAEPRSQHHRIVAPELLVEAGLALAREAEQAPDRTAQQRALAARNGLMIALLALDPIRLRNFAALALRDSFVREGDTWWIRLDDTKSGRPDERPVPALLNHCIARYLDVHRPVLLDGTSPPTGTAIASPIPVPARKAETALWISQRRQPMSRVRMQTAIAQTTQSILGVALFPHLFRKCAATSAALHGGRDNPNLASALLQHKHRSVVEEHYNRATSLSASREYAALVRDL